VEAALRTRWGRRFQAYGDGRVVMPGMERKTVLQAAAGLAALALLALGGVALLLRGG
jgi:predicted S18 family serine protease